MECRDLWLSYSRGPHTRTWRTSVPITFAACSPHTLVPCVSGLFTDDGERYLVLYTPNSTKRCMSWRMRMHERICDNCGCPAFSLASWKDTTTDLADTLVTDSFTSMTT